MNNFDIVVDRSQSDSIKWRTFPPDVLPLWVADMDFRAPEPILEALRRMNEHGVYGYGSSEGEKELLESWCERLDQRFHWQVRDEDLLVISGVVTGANLSCRALAAPGEQALVPAPVYGPLLSAPRCGQLETVPVPLACGQDGRYSLDIDALEMAVTPRTRLLILCNPHNPVGRVYTTEELAALAEFCERRDLTIISDEIHCDFVFHGHTHTPIATLNPEIAARTVTLMAPSKTFNIPGLQSSVAVVTNPKLRDQMREAMCGLVHGIAPIAKAATIAAFRHCQLWLDELLHYLQANRDILVNAIRARFPAIAIFPPEGTYLAWLDCREACLPVPAHTFFLEQARVALSSGCSFGEGNESFVRLNYGCPRVILLQALDRMAAAWEAQVRLLPQRG